MFLVETNFEASTTLFLKHFGASDMALTKARLLKHDFPVHNGETGNPENGWRVKVLGRVLRKFGVGGSAGGGVAKGGFLGGKEWEQHPSTPSRTPNLRSTLPSMESVNGRSAEFFKTSVL